MTIRSDSTRQRIAGRDPRRPRAVVARQGQVLLDADLDQQARLQLDRVEVETTDVLGPANRLMVRGGSDGFKVAPGGGIALGAGRGYLGGWLLENPAPCTFATQPHPRTGDSLGNRGVAVLKSLVRHIDPAEEGAWADVALGDAQASGRALNDWQAFAFIPDQGGALSCAELLARPDWQKLVQPSNGVLAIVPLQAPASTNPCSLTPGGGYGRLENLLYRIEVDGGVPRGDYPAVDGPRFGLNGLRLKFSRRNGSILARITGRNEGLFTVAAPPLDPLNWFAPGSYAEIVSLHDDLDPRAALAAKRLFPVSSVLGTEVTLDLDGADLASMNIAADGTWFLRLWDAFADDAGIAIVSVTGNPVTSAVVDLGDGIGVQLGGGAQAIFRRGDYWLCPARADGSLDWPFANGAYQPQAPHGPETRYAPLAVVGGSETSPEDCRIPFATLSDRMLLYRGGDGQSVFPNGATSGFVTVPGPLRVAVLRGETPVPNAQVVWSAADQAPPSRINGQPVGGAAKVITETDANGLAQVDWAIDAAQLSQRHGVTAALVTGPTPGAPPVLFGATFATARATAYEPGNCEHLLKVNNVQEALDTLCREIGGNPRTLGLCEIVVGGVQAQRQELIRGNLILNGAEVKAATLADGLAFNFTRSPRGIAPQKFDPLVEIELDIPFPSTDLDRFYWAIGAAWGGQELVGPFGFQRVRLDGTVAVRGEKESRGDLVWRPSAAAEAFLHSLPSHLAGQRILVDEWESVLKRIGWQPGPMFNRLLCRIRLRSALIWADDADGRIYLNAEHVGTSDKVTGRELLLRELDGQRAADLDMFVYLTFPLKVAPQPNDGMAGDLSARGFDTAFSKDRFDLRDVLTRQVAVGGGPVADSTGTVVGETVNKGPAGGGNVADQGAGKIGDLKKKGGIVGDAVDVGESLAKAFKKGRGGRTK